ncbi:MAG TPA: TetR/AcrR family transcriptional regulator, partial [Ktedonobacterales bacterium]|nr:TetR/AcrR family transcriptional regulator [Ktedonobacterales bacterium]
YEATTIKAVAQVAGVAPGLIHYYFASKEELLAAVLEDAAARYADEMRQLSDALPPESAITAAIAARKARVEREPNRERLRFELFTLGLRQPALRPAVARVLATGREGVGRLLAANGNAPKDDIEGMAAVFLAMLDGLALQWLIDPDFDLAGAYRAVERLARLAGYGATS